MSDRATSTRDRFIYLLQVSSVLFIWIFVIIIATWITNLISLSIELNDVPGASVAISIVAVPVFFTLAAVLTYVFVGLQKGKHRSSETSEEK